MVKVARWPLRLRSDLRGDALSFLSSNNAANHLSVRPTPPPLFVTPFFRLLQPPGARDAAEAASANGRYPRGGLVFPGIAANSGHCPAAVHDQRNLHRSQLSPETGLVSRVSSFLPGEGASLENKAFYRKIHSNQTKQH